MSGDRYHIDDQHAIYFLTFTVVDWIDVFARPEYKMIIVDSLNYCIENKGLVCYAWVLMTNHMHIIVRAEHPNRLSDVIRDYKKFTSKKLVESIDTITESRREWLLHKFEFNAKVTRRADNSKFWQDSNHAICLEGGGNRMQERIQYIHQNPVRQQIVAFPEDYIFSSAGDYAGRKGLVTVAI